MSKSPLFSKKHYEAAANRLKYEFDLRVKTEIRCFLIDLFSSDNSKFDSEKFSKACKVEK